MPSALICPIAVASAVALDAEHVIEIAKSSATMKVRAAPIDAAGKTAMLKEKSPLTVRLPEAVTRTMVSLRGGFPGSRKLKWRTDF